VREAHNIVQLAIAMALLAKVLSCEGKLTFDTNTIVAQILESTNPKDAAQRRFQKFGGISNIDLLPGAVPVVSVTFYDVRAAALAVAANEHALWGSCRPGPQKGDRCVQISGESSLSPKALTGVSKLDCDPDDGTSYTVEFFDVRDAEAQKREEEAKQLRRRAAKRKVEAEAKKNADDETKKVEAKSASALPDSEFRPMLERISTLAEAEAKYGMVWKAEESVTVWYGRMVEAEAKAMVEAEAKAQLEEETKKAEAKAVWYGRIVEAEAKAMVEAEAKAEAKAKVEEDTKKKKAEEGVKMAVEEVAMQKPKEDADKKREEADRPNVCLLGRITVGQQILPQKPGQDTHLLRQTCAKKQA